MVNRNVPILSSACQNKEFHKTCAPPPYFLSKTLPNKEGRFRSLLITLLKAKKLVLLNVEEHVQGQDSEAELHLSTARDVRRI